MTHQPQRAVIFDVDGVLVDSYQAHRDSWLQLAAETGVAFTERQFAATFGQTSHEVLRAHWASRIADEGDLQRLEDRKESLYRDAISATFPLMPGARELIDDLLNDGWRLAVGSSGPPANVELALDRLQRRTAFSAVVTGHDVSRGKPDPEVFLLAAKRLEAAPGRCVVIEDAPPGVRAAIRAGMTCVGLLSTGRHPSDFDHDRPTLLIKSLAELDGPRLVALMDTARQRS